MTTQPLSIEHPSIKYGIIGGIVYILLSTILWIISPELLISPIRIVPYAIILAIGIFAGVQLREAQGGLISFGQALLGIFLCYLIIEVIWAGFMLLLYNVIDPGLNVELKRLTIQASEEWFDKLNVPESDREEALEAMEAQSFNFDLKNAGITVLTYAGLEFVVALITAAIIKKKEEDLEAA